MDITSITNPNIPGLDREDKNIRDIATSGYVMVVNLKNLTPEYYHTTYPSDWEKEYSEKRYILCDPTLIWATQNEGYARWSDDEIRYTDNINDQVMNDAKKHGLNFGVIISYKNNPNDDRRHIFSAARSDREFKDFEIEILTRSFRRIFENINSIKTLGRSELVVLQGIAMGLSQSDIAQAENITHAAIKKRLEKARKILGAKTAAQAVAIASSRKLLTFTSSPFE